LLHHVDRLLGLLQAEGIAPSHDARLYLGAQDEQWCDDLMAEHGWSDGSYACLAPTSQWICKCWPIARFLEIGRRLRETGVAGGRLVVLSGPGQRDYIRPMLDSLAADARPERVIAPATTVGQLMALIQRSRLVVCNDSAVAHAAVGFDKPAACIYGPTDPHLVGPYRRDDTVVRPATAEGLGSIGFYRHQGRDQSLIAKVTVEQVWQKIMEQVAAGAEDRGHGSGVRGQATGVRGQ
jgi:ADP-heptose:LPS heptosyltransferase